mmetsp:Transcript_6205/g.11543  ORF Transcript_6205/g.11543 Transcript_6205/m.11543 type:complete len:1032 (-) Transcript_6205:5478-8573(-)
MGADWNPTKHPLPPRPPRQRPPLTRTNHQPGPQHRHAMGHRPPLAIHQPPSPGRPPPPIHRLPRRCQHVSTGTPPHSQHRGRGPGRGRAGLGKRVVTQLSMALRARRSLSRPRRSEQGGRGVAARGPAAVAEGGAVRVADADALPAVQLPPRVVVLALVQVGHAVRQGVGVDALPALRVAREDRLDGGVLRRARGVDAVRDLEVEDPVVDVVAGLGAHAVQSDGQLRRLLQVAQGGRGRVDGDLLPVDGNGGARVRDAVEGHGHQRGHDFRAVRRGDLDDQRTATAQPVEVRVGEKLDVEYAEHALLHAGRDGGVLHLLGALGDHDQVPGAHALPNAGELALQRPVVEVGVEGGQGLVQGQLVQSRQLELHERIPRGVLDGHLVRRDPRHPGDDVRELRRVEAGAVRAGQADHQLRRHVAPAEAQQDLPPPHLRVRGVAHHRHAVLPVRADDADARGVRQGPVGVLVHDVAAVGPQDGLHLPLRRAAHRRQRVGLARDVDPAEHVAAVRRVVHVGAAPGELAEVEPGGDEVVVEDGEAVLPWGLGGERAHVVLPRDRQIGQKAVAVHVDGRDALVEDLERGRQVHFAAGLIADGAGEACALARGIARGPDVDLVEVPEIHQLDPRGQHVVRVAVRREFEQRRDLERRATVRLSPVAVGQADRDVAQPFGRVGQHLLQGDGGLGGVGAVPVQPVPRTAVLAQCDQGPRLEGPRAVHVQREQIVDDQRPDVAVRVLEHGELRKGLPDEVAAVAERDRGIGLRERHLNLKAIGLLRGHQLCGEGRLRTTACAVVEMDRAGVRGVKVRHVDVDGQQFPRHAQLRDMTVVDEQALRRLNREGTSHGLGVGAHTAATQHVRAHQAHDGSRVRFQRREAEIVVRTAGIGPGGVREICDVGPRACVLADRDGVPGAIVQTLRHGDGGLAADHRRPVELHGVAHAEERCARRHGAADGLRNADDDVIVLVGEHDVDDGDAVLPVLVDVGPKLRPRARCLEEADGVVLRRQLDLEQRRHAHGRELGLPQGHHHLQVIQGDE